MNETNPHPRHPDIPNLSADHLENRALADSYREWVDRIDATIEPSSGPSGGAEMKGLLKAYALDTGLEYDSEASPIDELRRIKNQLLLELDHLKRNS